jgi:hydrogenase/urease accessory protein HupE
MRTVFAHLVSTGVGPFYDGAAHFLISVEEILPVVALGVLAGLRGARAGRWMTVMIPVTWLAGGLVGLERPLLEPPVMLTIGLLLVPGLLVAWDRQLPLGVVLAVSMPLSLWTGYSNGSAMAVAGVGILAVCGAAAVAALVVTLVSALAVAQRGGWPRVALRVAGSWMAALGLLSLGWFLNGKWEMGNGKW